MIRPANSEMPRRTGWKPVIASVALLGVGLSLTIGCSSSNAPVGTTDGGDATHQTSAAKDTGVGAVDGRKGSEGGKRVDGGSDGGDMTDGGVDSGVDGEQPIDAGQLADGFVPDGGGWTVFPALPGVDGGYLRAIYVDSVEGKETNTGVSASEALKNVGASSTLYTELKSATATSEIVVLLKPGSAWPDQLLEVPVGGTAEFPLLVSGTKWPNAGQSSRPQLAGVRITSGGVNHVAIEGLEIGPYPTPFPKDAGVAPSSIGIEITEPGGTDYLVEDCLITNFYDLVQASGSHTAPLTNFRMRRSYLFGAYGSGPVVAFGGEDVNGELIEENVFDYNGGPSATYDGGTGPNYLDTTLRAPYTNIYAHDVYFADDGSQDAGRAVIADNVDFRHNLFSRTLESIKGPYSGVLDDNLFYNYSSGGFMGPYGGQFTNNVLMNGGGFQTALDNSHDPNTNPAAITTFCNNLEYNEPAPKFTVPYEGAFQAMNQPVADAVGVNLHFVGNVIDGFSQGLLFNDPGCFGYTIENNLVTAAKLYEFSGTWPLPGCPLTVSGNSYYEMDGGYALERTDDGGSNRYPYSGLESFLKEDGGTLATAQFSYADPERDISTYLVAAGLASGTSSPTLIDFLKLIRTQAQTTHQWNPALSVAVINTYLRPGHSLTNRPFGYRTSCP